MSLYRFLKIFLISVNNSILSEAGDFEKLLKDKRAALTALSKSLAEPTYTLPIIYSLAGLIRLIVSFSIGSTHFPSI